MPYTEGKDVPVDKKSDAKGFTKKEAEALEKEKPAPNVKGQAITYDKDVPEGELTVEQARKKAVELMNSRK